MNHETILRIVKASGVTSGELILVHFWGEDSDKEIANRFMVAVAELGASPVLLQQARTINRDIFNAAKESSFGERYFDMFSMFDAVIDVFAYRPVVLGYEIPDKQTKLYRGYVSKLFYKLMGCRRFTQIRVPTEANAEEASLDPQDYIRRLERAYDIDYETLRSECEKEVKRLSSANNIIVHTGDNCALNFEINGRTWHIDAGDGDIPCGEIYIAPLESKTNGDVYFETFYMDGEKYCNVTLHVLNGEVCSSSHPHIAERFRGMPRENRIVCEFGIGMNPNITDMCGYTVLDEKMVGTFHIGVGANDMFGGENKASEHTDFVGYGEVEVIA